MKTTKSNQHKLHTIIHLYLIDIQKLLISYLGTRLEVQVY